MNTLNTTPANIEWLVEKLYAVGRELSSTDKELNRFERPERVFVMVTDSKEKRHAIEEIMLRYLSKKYGFDPNNTKSIAYDMHPLESASTFRFPNGVTLSVIDLE